MASKRTQGIKTHDWLQADVVSLLCERKRRASEQPGMTVRPNLTAAPDDAWCGGG